jgi:hypothetical protein
MMAEFAGYVQEGSTAVLTIHTVDTVGTPTAPEAAPSYAVYDTDASATMPNGTGTMTSTTTGWYRCSVACTTANGYAAGNNYHARFTYDIGTTSYATDQTFAVV